MAKRKESALPMIEAKRSEVTTVCRQFGVRRLEIFGSAATGEYDPEQSDLDFLVEFGGDGPRRALDAYFGLKEALERIFERRVDLVIPEAVRNPYFRAEMERTRKSLYVSSTATPSLITTFSG